MFHHPLSPRHQESARAKSEEVSGLRGTQTTAWQQAGRDEKRVPAAGRRSEKTRMISSKLAKRLERLEARLAPAGEPHVIQIVFVSTDGSSRDGPRFVLKPGRDRAWQRKSRWR